MQAQHRSAEVYEKTGQRLDVDRYRVLDEYDAALSTLVQNGDIDNLLADARVPEDAEAEDSVDLERGLLVGITLHLAQPGGLAEFLDRKLHGPAPALTDLANHQHRRVGVETPTKSEV